MSELAAVGPLIDVHAHFWHAGAGRADWRAVNAARLRAGREMGVTCHVASVLGSYGHTSPTYFASPRDVVAGNDAMFALCDEHGPLVRAYVHVNPNDREVAIAELARGAARGAIGLKLSASRRADDALVDPVVAEAGRLGFPVLHHVWQWRRRDWGGQEASDGVELARLAERHPGVSFILAHIGGGGDYMHTFHAVRDLPNVLLDLSGSGSDRGMLDMALEAVGTRRLLWGCDITMCTGLAKLRALDVIGLTADDVADVRWRNAARIFPPGAFGAAPATGASPGTRQARRIPLDVHTFIGSYPHRQLPHPDPEVLVRVLAREGIAEAWTGHLPTAFHRDPAPGNDELLARLAPHRGVLHPTPVIRPDWPGWERQLAGFAGQGVPAVRAYPAQWGMGPGDAAMHRLVGACGEAGVALALTVRFEDLRQRGPLDAGNDLTPAHVRLMARVSPTARIVVCAAGREFVDEVHWGLTPDERRRVWFDLSWLWGPPEDHLATLFRTIGSDRFCYGTAWPLRLTQVPAANLALLPADMRELPLGDPRG